jgi:hypothetical protein
MDQQNEGEKPTNDDMDIALKSSLGFADLALTVAARLKTLDESNKAVFEARAWIDNSRYRVQLYVWRRDRATRETGRQLVLQEYKCILLLPANPPMRLRHWTRPKRWCRTNSNDKQPFANPPKMVPRNPDTRSSLVDAIALVSNDSQDGYVTKRR